MPHKHAWRTTGYVLLSLPRQGFAERLMQWHCTTCPEYCVITGDVRLGTPLHTPPYWDAARAHEQRANTPEAQAARQNERRRMR